jgi:polar amino acid transport system permease protein
MIPEWIAPVLRHMANGLLITLWLATLSVILATVIGAGIGIVATIGPRWVRLAVRIYVDIFRGIPSLIVLLFVFFQLPQLGISTDALTASILALGIWASANIGEIARGAVQSVSPKQSEAAAALGMNRVATLNWVILPQALRRFLPPYLGQLTVIIQATALSSIVGVSDLQGSARQMVERLAYSTGDGQAIFIYSVVLLVFFGICYPLTVLGTRLERRLKV